LPSCVARLLNRRPLGLFSGRWRHAGRQGRL